MSLKTSTKILALACLISLIASGLAAPQKHHHMKESSHKREVKDLAQTSQGQAQGIPDAYYYIVNGNGLCLELPDCNVQAGTQLVQDVCTGQQDQQWQVQQQGGSGAPYVIYWYNTQSVVLDSCSQGGDGNQIQIWNWIGKSGQQWTINNITNSPIIFQDSGNWCIDTIQPTLTPGNIVSLQSCNGSLSQSWTFIPMPNYPGPFTISSLASGLCLTSPDDVNLQLSPCGSDEESANEQQWYINIQNAGQTSQYYQIVLNSNNNLNLDIAGSNGIPGTTPGVNVVLAANDNGNDQQWTIVPFAAVPGAFFFVNLDSNLTLSVLEYSTQAGAEIVQYPFQGSDTQLWNLNLVGSS